MKFRISLLATLSLSPACSAQLHDDLELREGEACLYPETLEITGVDIGQGDASIIATPTKIILADVGESYWNSHADALALDAALMGKYGCRNIDHVIISHFQVDHVGYPGYGGLWYLAEVLGYSIGETLVRDLASNVGSTSGTYDNWMAYLASTQGQALLNPRTPVPGEVLDLGAGVSLTITNVDTRTASCPGGWGSAPDFSCGGEYVYPSEVLGDHSGDSTVPSENDYSVGFVVSIGDFDMYIGGDTNGETAAAYGTKNHDIESYVATDVGEVDVLRLNHHGSDHSSNASFIAALDPQAAVISVGNANTFGHARQAVIDRVLGVIDGAPTRDTWLYLTERGDDGEGGCLKDYANSSKAAAELYGRATVVSDTDGDYCTIEGGDVDIVVSSDGATFSIEGTPYVSSVGVPTDCDDDGICEDGEDCVNCPVDCVAASGGGCGDGICEVAAGESCVSCPADCGGKQNGKASGRFCCGDGNGENPVDCSDSRCSEGALDCSNEAVGTACCGDGTCSELEDGVTCGIDCGAPPATSCGDGVCKPGEDCESCPEDCDGKLKGAPSDRYCCGDGAADAPEGDGVICDGNY